MQKSSKILIILCCLFVFAFKVAAANTYISNGIKIAQFDDYLNKIALEKSSEKKDKFLNDYVKTLNLMAHVLGVEINIDLLFMRFEVPQLFNSYPPASVALGLPHPIDKPPKA